jgi:hypothetical protein
VRCARDDGWSFRCSLKTHGGGIDSREKFLAAFPGGGPQTDSSSDRSGGGGGADSNRRAAGGLPPPTPRWLNACFGGIMGATIGFAPGVAIYIIGADDPAMVRKCFLV